MSFLARAEHDIGSDIRREYFALFKAYLMSFSAIAALGLATPATAQGIGGSGQTGEPKAQESSETCHKSPQIFETEYVDAPISDVEPSVPVPLLGGTKNCRIEPYAGKGPQLYRAWYEAGEAGETNFIVSYSQDTSEETIAGYIGTNAVPDFGQYYATTGGKDTECKRAISGGPIMCELYWSNEFGIKTVTRIEGGKVVEMTIDMGRELSPFDGSVKITIGGQTIQRSVRCDPLDPESECSINLALPQSQAVTQAAVQVGSARITIVDVLGKREVDTDLLLPDLRLAAQMQHRIAQALAAAP